MGTALTQLQTDVLVVGAGPAGLTATLALRTYGVATTVITKHAWLSPTARAHNTNQRTFEIFRALGIDRETDALATPYTELPDIVFCTSLTGQEIARMRVLGTGPSRCGEYIGASPCKQSDFAQNLMEPALLKAALSRGANIRFSTEYLSSTQDDMGVRATLHDRITSEIFDVRARYMIGADGGRSDIAAELRLPMAGEADLGGSYNISFACDLSNYVAHRPAVLYFIVRDGRSNDGAGFSFLRPTRRWDQWLLTKGYEIGRDNPELDEEAAKRAVRDYLGDDTLDVRITALDTWTLNAMRAERYGEGRIFCVGDAVHRHAPSNGLGSNTGIADAYNLAWKLAHVLRGDAGRELLDSYDQERVPIGRLVVDRATKSLKGYATILAALGLDDTSPEAGIAKMGELTAASPEGAARRKRLADAFAEKQFEFNAHGIETNQYYTSSAIIGEESSGLPTGSLDRDSELYYAPTTAPGARIPHVWVQRAGRPVSTLDLVGKGRFTIVTGIGGAPWLRAARAMDVDLGLAVNGFAIGPGCDHTDLYGEWAQLREIQESGCLLIRPDGYIAWRADVATETDREARESLRNALSQILGRSGATSPHARDHNVLA